MVRIGGLLFGILPAAGGVKQALAAAGITCFACITCITCITFVSCTGGALGCALIAVRDALAYTIAY